MKRKPYLLMLPALVVLGVSIFVLQGCKKEEKEDADSGTFTHTRDGSGNHKVDIPITVFSPSFTQGGSRIMFNSIINIVERDLFLFGTDGSNLQRLESPNIGVGHAMICCVDYLFTLVFLMCLWKYSEQMQ